MPQRNDRVSVEVNGRVIDVPQSYVDRFPEQYQPAKLNKDGSVPANSKAVDARGESLPPFATTPDDLPSTSGSSSTSTTPPVSTGTATSTGAAATGSGAAATTSTGGASA